MLIAKWISEAGLPCCIVKHDMMGHLCGYVGVPKSHPWYAKHYRDGLDVEVHGGITYSDYGYDPMPRDGEWWFGFDCAHAFDVIPGLPGTGMGVYRNESYVRGECERMAEQLMAINARTVTLKKEAM